MYSTSVNTLILQLSDAFADCMDGGGIVRLYTQNWSQQENDQAYHPVKLGEDLLRLYLKQAKLALVLGIVVYWCVRGKKDCISLIRKGIQTS